jgi:peptide chain release factor 1
MCWTGLRDRIYEWRLSARELRVLARRGYHDWDADLISLLEDDAHPPTTTISRVPCSSRETVLKPSTNDLKRSTSWNPSSLKSEQQKGARTASSSSMTSSACTFDGPGGGVFEIELLEERPGLAVCKVSGQGAWEAFRHEGGGHRFQRVPPTEKRGRVQTSTVTVAVLSIPDDATVQLLDRDLEWQATRGSGAGGQARNKTSNCVILTHRPSGMTVRCESERSQIQNLNSAKSLLRARLHEQKATAADGDRNAARKAQLGVGARGDKRRTIAVQRDQVTDHVLGTRMTADRYLKGDLAPIYA